MANLNAPFGLRPSRSLGRSNVQCNSYAHDSGDSVALFRGDPVVTTGTSTSAVNGIADGTPIVAASGTITTTAIRGAIVDVRPTLTNLSLNYCPASVNLEVFVADDPYQLFDIMSNGTAAVGDVSGNIGITAGSGSTVTGMSAYVATESSLGSTNVLRIIRIAPVVNNAVGANAVFECSVNAHELKSTSGT
jgi:hypothetical protein